MERSISAKHVAGAGAGVTVVAALASIAVALEPGLSVAGHGRFSIFMLCAGTTAAGALLGLVAIVWNGTSDQSKATWYLGVLSLFAAACGAIGSVLAGMKTEQYSHGRPFRRRGKHRTARSEASERWLDAAAPLSAIPDELREGLAAEWRRNGAKEHASIAAFTQLSIDLIALGAPPRLLAEIHGDALDEIRHAQLCFSIARDLDGRAEGPATFPEARESPLALPSRTLALSKLAIDAIVDGALNEGVSARILGRLSRSSTEPRLAHVLREMAADESRHAGNSWNVVAFAIDAGGPRVVEALRGALRTLPVRMTAPLPASARGGAWEAFGVQGEATESAAWVSTRRYVVARLSTILDRSQHAPIAA